MGKTTRPTLARLHELQRRQGTHKFGPDYQAGIRAVREEAPAHSRPSQIWVPKFGRYLHALSSVERDVFAITVNDPRVLEALDQYVLPTTPAPNWLTSSPFPRAQGTPALLRGTIAVANELGALAIHPRVRHQELGEVPFPYIGDMLAFLQICEEQVLSINVSIKASPEDFERPYKAGRQPRDMSAAVQKERLRHKIEEQLHGEVGTRTVRVTAADYSAVYARNIRWAHEVAHAEQTLPAHLVNVAEEVIASSAVKSQPALQAFSELSERHGIRHEQSRIVFANALLARRLPIDLTRDHVVIDQPLVYRPADQLQEVAWLNL